MLSTIPAVVAKIVFQHRFVDRCLFMFQLTDLVFELSQLFLHTFHKLVFQPEFSPKPISLGIGLCYFQLYF